MDEAWCGDRSSVAVDQEDCGGGRGRRAGDGGAAAAGDGGVRSDLHQRETKDLILLFYSKSRQESEERVFVNCL